MDRPHSMALLVALALLSFAACGGGGGGEHAASRSEPARPSSAWTVRFGSRGGFTGGGQGHLVHADGRVQSWAEITPGDAVSLREAGKASAAALGELHDAMTDPALVAITHQETGNLTGFLEWIEDGKTRRYSWAERAGEPGLPEPLSRALAAARAAVASASE